MANVRDEDIDELVRFYNGARRIARGASTRWGRTEVSILILSAVTTGSLWGLLSNALPAVTLWAGAVLATSTTIVSAYSKYTDDHSTVGEALAIHAEIGEFLGKVRASPTMTQEEYWPRHKKLETSLHDLAIRSGFEWHE